MHFKSGITFRLLGTNQFLHSYPAGVIPALLQMQSTSNAAPHNSVISNPPPISFPTAVGADAFEGIASGQWDSRALGISDPSAFKIKTGKNARLTKGEEGVIYFQNDSLEAIGLCARGLIKGDDDEDRPNEDSIGIYARDDGAVLIHLADGMGGHGHGHIASDAVIEGMARFVGERKVAFDIASELTASRMMQRFYPNPRYRGIGSTYSGLLVPSDPAAKAIMGNIGDSQLTILHGGTDMFTSIPDNFCRLYFTSDQENLLTLMRQIGNQDVKRLVERIVNETPEGSSYVEQLALLFQYTHRRIPLMSVFVVDEENQRRITPEEVDRRSGLTYAIYSDGLGDNMSPVNLARFISDDVPLHEVAYQLGLDIMLRQGAGADIDIGMPWTLPVAGKKDNYSFWLVRMR